MSAGKGKSTHPYILLAFNKLRVHTIMIILTPVLITHYLYTTEQISQTLKLQLKINDNDTSNIYLIGIL